MNKDSFLYDVAKDIINNYNQDFSNLNVIFPNKRAIAFFNEAIYDIINKPFLSPKYFSISDFISKNTNLVIGDELSLVYYLYQVYSEVYYTNNPVKDPKEIESFDSFFLWGKILLSDFDDIDKNLGDTKSLFRNIEDYRALEDRFDFLTEDQKKVLSSFFSSFREENPSQINTRFLSIWNSLLEIYNKYKEFLIAKGIGYQGMIYRQIVEDNQLDNTLFDKEQEFSIIGFNVLNKAEEKLFKDIKDNYQSRFYWDSDNYYIKDIKQEAGSFLRENIKNFPMPNSFNYFSENIKTRKQIIEIINSPGENAQVNYIDKFFSSIEGDKDIHQSDIAIILGNESLLPNILNALPEKINGEDTRVNITMGYEFKSTPLFSLIISYLKLEAALIKSKTISLNDILPFIEHPYWEDKNKDIKEYIKKLKDNRIGYLDNMDAFGFSDILEPKNTPLELVKSIQDILVLVAKENTNSSNNKSSIDKVIYEVIYRIYLSINRLRDIISQNEMDIDINLFHRIIISELNNISIPFEGDPINGVQVMGLLETRNLDFKYVILLSANDDLIPRVSSENSFIPYSIRKAYNLSTIDKKISVFAYYFYRLLHRAKDISFVYNSVNSSSTKKEISRFLNQIIIEFQNHQEIEENKEIKYFVLGSNINLENKQEIRVYKQDTHIDKIKKKSYISASYLNDYLDCPLRFYFKRIAGITPFEPYDDSINPMDFGNIFHKSAQEIYNYIIKNKTDNKTNNLINQIDIEEVLKNKPVIDIIIRNAFYTEFLKQDPSSNFNLKQIHSINIEVIKEYIENLLISDLSYCPFIMVSMEDSFIKDILGIRAGGKIDRIDFKDGILRLIDYKTGRAEENKNNKSTPSIENLFGKGYENDNYPKRHKNKFQIMFYSWLIKDNFSEIQDKLKGLKINIIKPEIKYIIQLKDKSINPNIILKHDNTDKNQEVEDYRDFHELFNKELETTLSELLEDNKEEYLRRKSEANCMYCDFLNYCF